MLAGPITPAAEPSRKLSCGQDATSIHRAGLFALAFTRTRCINPAASVAAIQRSNPDGVAL